MQNTLHYILLEITRNLREARIDVLKSLYVDKKIVDADEFKKISDADPTPNYTYTGWLLNRYKKEIVSVIEPGQQHGIADTPDGLKRRFFEDLDDMKEFLEIFHRIKARFPKQDISQYTLDEFKRAALDVIKKHGNDPEVMGKGQEKDDKYADVLLGKVGPYNVYELTGKAQAPTVCALGSNTRWCTRPSVSTSEGYLKDGSIYIIINQEDPTEKYQFHFQSDQFMDSDDWHIGLDGEKKLRDVFGLISAKSKEEPVQIVAGLKSKNPALVKRANKIIDGVVKKARKKDIGNFNVFVYVRNKAITQLEDYLQLGTQWYRLGGEAVVLYDEQNAIKYKITPGYDYVNITDEDNDTVRDFSPFQEVLKAIVLDADFNEFRASMNGREHAELVHATNNQGLISGYWADRSGEIVDNYGIAETDTLDILQGGKGGSREDNLKDAGATIGIKSPDGQWYDPDFIFTKKEDFGSRVAFYFADKVWNLSLEKALANEKITVFSKRDKQSQPTIKEIQKGLVETLKASDITFSQKYQILIFLDKKEQADAMVNKAYDSNFKEVKIEESGPFKIYGKELMSTLPDKKKDLWNLNVAHSIEHHTANANYIAINTDHPVTNKYYILTAEKSSRAYSNNMSISKGNKKAVRELTPLLKHLLKKDPKNSSLKALTYKLLGQEDKAQEAGMRQYAAAKKFQIGHVGGFYVYTNIDSEKAFKVFGGAVGRLANHKRGKEMVITVRDARPDSVHVITPKGSIQHTGLVGTMQVSKEQKNGYRAVQDLVNKKFPDRDWHIGRIGYTKPGNTRRRSRFGRGY